MSGIQLKWTQTFLYFFFKYIRVVELSNTSYCVVLHILATSFCSDQINLN